MALALPSPTTMTDALSSSSLSSPSPCSSSSTQYKGKVLRSWAQLPADIIQLIATFYIMQVSAASYIPNTWDIRDNWPRRNAYVTLRDAVEMEKLMWICPSWGAALETHLYWPHALAVVDPHDVYGPQRVMVPPSSTAGSNASASPIRPTPYRMFRNVTNSSCIICRINFPWQNNGLGTAKRLVATLRLGAIAICRDHYSRKDAFCGLCLREGPPTEVDAEYSTVCCYANDDEDSWPGIISTCRNCRMEGLWARVMDRPVDREAVGGHKWRSPDWEVRQSIESFLDIGEGTIMDVITLAREKHWLRRHTKLADMLQQALASARYVARTEAGEAGYGSDEEMSDEEDEDDAEFMSATEDQGGVKDLAIADWARNRILDGFWISPADQWYNNFSPNYSWDVPAQHPCPWNRDALYSGALEEGESGNGDVDLEHPRPKTVKAEVPPSFNLCDYAFRSFQRCMRDVLLPALQNLVRKIVIECNSDGTDPTLRASRMSMDEVVQELRDEAVWFNGIDWLERRANRAREERDRIRTQAPRSGTAEEDDSSSSSRSDGSHTTSPVLSTTTLQTTPSPPPSGDPSSSPKDEEMVTSSPTMSANVQLPIPISPVLKSPTLIHPIPYIPVTTAHLPFYSMEALRHAWREACAPLYTCRCSICDRAILNANIASGAVVPSQAAPAVVQPATQPANVQRNESKSVMIHIQKPSSRQHFVRADEEEEEEDESDSILDSDDGYVSENADEEFMHYLEAQEQKVSVQPGKIVYPVTPRKRPSQELEPDDPPDLPNGHGDLFLDDNSQDDRRRTNNGTPPKRARVDEGCGPLSVGRTRPASPTTSSKTLLEGDRKKARTPLALPRTPAMVRE